jgi:hypothetical protein
MNRLPCDMLGIANQPENLIVYTDSFSSEEFKNFGEVDAYLVSSFEEKKIVTSNFGINTEVLTFGESTGLTFNKGVILITFESLKTSENRWITALSRFRENICFVNLLGIPYQTVAEMFIGRILCTFMTARTDQSYFIDHLPGRPIFTKDYGSRIGLNSTEREQKLSGDPWLKTMINLVDEEEVEDVKPISEIYDDEIMKTHIPNITLMSYYPEVESKIKLREKREFRIGHMTSEQFCDDHYKGNGKKLTNAAQRFESIYPRHKGTDSVTFIMAVKKRLRFSNPVKENQKFRKAKPYGKFLLQEFLKMCPIRNDAQDGLLREAVNEFEEKKLSKPTAIIANHAGRSCRDWLADLATIFMKSQLCTKYEKRFNDAKAGQTLACFHHSVLCRFAPFIRYMEKKVNNALNKRFYIHSGKNFDDLNNYCINNNFFGICTESDYEAFDSSQDSYIMAFEYELMKFLNIPYDLIEDYIYIKTHLRSKLGNFAIMRFTGEASTFLFNTLANMLFTQLRYNINSHVSICFAGDDMCANQDLKIRKEHDEFLGKMSLKAKVARTTKPTFCGWFMTKYGIIKNPKLLLERLLIAKERDNLHNCIDSYAIECSYAYKKSENLYNILDESEMNAHHLCVRNIVKNKNIMKSEIGRVFFKD